MSTSSSTACPSCGSEDRVTGRADGSVGDVELTCGRCGRSWWRGGRRCATCGGVLLTTRPQVMRRHSRGTQLSIVGWRDTVLCEHCDADLLATLGTGHTPVPEEYVSAALVDRDASPPTVRPAPQEVPARAPDRPVPAARHAAPVSARGRASPLPTRQPAAPAPPPRPTTVRQALQESQAALATAATDLDPTVVLLLGTHLGPSTRLDALERSGHDADSLRDWVERTWGRGARGAAARHTLTAVADHWSTVGWTTTDLAAGVRPQEDA